MSIRILTILILLITRISFCQQLAIEAVYYNKDEVPYKLERKYVDKDVVTYVAHYNRSSVCVKRQTYFSGDTIIIKEASYSILNKKTRIEQFQDCDNWIVSSNIKGDTAWLKGYRTDISSDSIILIGDTILIGEAAKESMDFSERIKNARVPLILDKKMIIKMDSLILGETVFAYYLNSIPVKVEVYDSDNKHYSTILGAFYPSKLIYKNYFKDDGLSFEVDTVSWNKDTTDIRWSSTSFEQKQLSISKFKMEGNTLQVFFDDTTKKQIEYLDNRYLFQNLLIGKLIYSDVLYYMELRYFDREKILSSIENKRVISNKYTFDTENRIIEQVLYNNGQFQKRVEYKYNN